jgi:hypothetical protein
MINTEVHQPVLTPEDWAIVVDLLRLEQKELPSEIRHTSKRAFRHHLEQRLEGVERLLERLREFEAKE